MNVLQNLTELYNHLPVDSTYREVAKGILENLNRLQSDFTIYDLAEITNSSRTTVWRMLQKMGYENFTDFRHALKTASGQYNYYNRMLPGTAETDPEKVLDTVEKQIDSAAAVLHSSFTSETIDEIAKQIHLAKKIRFYFPYRLPMVYSLQQNLAMDGKDTAYFCLLPEILEDTENLDENTLIFISCIEFAETMDMTGVFRNAQKQGACICLLGSENSRYRRMADHILLDKKADIFSWLTALEGMFLAISEYYRALYIDIW